MLLLKKLFFILVIFSVQFVLAQHPVSIHLTQRDGLPDINFYDLTEDEKGFIWFACNKGLYRYDGNEFKHFTHPDKRGLSVFNLQFDKQKKLWCTNLSGQFFYVENDNLHLAFDTSKDLKIEKLFNFTFFENSIIANSHTYCLKKNLDDKKLVFLKKKEKEFYTSLTERNDTLFLIGYNEFGTKIHYFEKGGSKFKVYSHFSEVERSMLYLDRNSKLITHQIQPYSKDLIIRQIFKDSIGLLPKLSFSSPKKINQVFLHDSDTWYLTEKGAEIFSEIDSLGTLESINHYFPQKNITKVAKDKQENYWFATLNNGVYVVPNIHLNAYDIRKDIGNITSIESVNNKYIYFGTTLGWLGIYNISKGTTKYVQLTKNGSKIRKILFNKKLNDVYIAGNYDKENFIVDASTQRIKSFENLHFGSAKSMVFLKSGSLFSSLVFNHTVIQFEKGGVKTRKIFDLRNQRVQTTFSDVEKGLVYVANIDELVMYDEKFNPTYVRYKNRPIMVSSITKTTNGKIWVSSFKNGLLAIENDKVVKQYTIKNGLLSNQINYIKADGNSIWITTQKGLQLLNTTTNTIKNLTQKDGVESFNITGIEVVGNIVWFNSNLGLFSFDKRKVFKTSKVVDPYFSSVTISDSTYAVQPKYTIAHDDKRIAIKFNANQFQTLENTKYQYRLKGYQDDWKPTPPKNNELVFNSLPKGNYKFQLRTVEGKNYSKVQEIQFKVEDVFYKQLWFVLLVSWLIIGLIINFYRNLLKKQNRDRRIENEKYLNELEKTALKLENLRSQMNPHFVFNALNSIQDYIINNQKNLAGDYLGKFADLIRMYLDQSVQKEIILSKEVDTLERYLELEKLRFEDKLTYEINIDKEIDADEIVIPTMLIQPYVENALKHGLLHKKSKGHLSVKFTLSSEENYLIIKIIDDGVGRKKSQEIKNKQTRKHESFATKATLNRLELLNFNKKNKIKIDVTDLNSDDNVENVGTIVTLQIPILE